jgi:hypothetical protein
MSADTKIPPTLRELFSGYATPRLKREIREARKRLKEAEPYESRNFHAAAVADCARRHLAAMESILADRGAR